MTTVFHLATRKKRLKGTTEGGYSTQYTGTWDILYFWAFIDSAWDRLHAFFNYILLEKICLNNVQNLWTSPKKLAQCKTESSRFEEKAYTYDHITKSRRNETCED